MKNKNLREYNDEFGKSNMEVLIDSINVYYSNCDIYEFSNKTEYSKYLVADKMIYDDENFKCINYSFRKLNNPNEDDYDARVKLYFYSNQEDAKFAMVESLNEYANYDIYLSSLNIGDLAIGNEKILKFIRGNVLISVYGYEIEITDLAKEIDDYIYKFVKI